MKKSKRNKKIRFKVSVDPSKVRNEFHFDVQRSTHAQVYKNKKAYTRKEKHKNKEINDD